MNMGSALVAGPAMSASGRRPPDRIAGFEMIERPLSGRADIWSGRTSANRPKAAVRCIWVRTTVTDPLLTPGGVRI